MPSLGHEGRIPLGKGSTGVFVPQFRERGI